nr:unnamed protein product [Naegleria fowleri]
MSFSSSSAANNNLSIRNEELWKELIQQLFSIASGEQLISVINVQHVQMDKKKGRVLEDRIVCVTTKKKMITTSKKKNGFKVHLLVIKRDKEGTFHIEKTYKLKRLAKIEGCEESNTEFILHFTNHQKPFRIISEGTEQKNIFISKLLHVCRENFGSEPVLENVNLAELSEYITEEEENDDENLFKDEIGDVSQKDLVTEEEEKIMRKVLEQFNEDMSDAKLVSSQLNQRLAIYERENIHAILQKQEQWERIIGQLDQVEGQLEEMNDWLERYNKKLMLMQKDIVQIESENNNMEVQARNLKYLSDEIDQLIHTLEFDDSYVQSIQNDEFDGKLSKINDAVQKLQDSLNEKFQDGMDDMVAVRERIKYFQILRFNFVNRFKIYMRKYFKKLASQMFKQTGKSFKYAIDLKSVNYNSYHRDIIQLHKDTIHKDLSKYSILMECVHSTQEAVKDHQLLEMLKQKMRESYGKFSLSMIKIKKDKMIDRPLDMLLLKYTKAVAPLYRKEIHLFIHDTKQVIKSNKENKVSKTFLLGTKSTQLNEKIIKDTKHAKRVSVRMPAAKTSNNNTDSSKTTLSIDDDEMTMASEIDFSDGEEDFDDEIIEYVKEQQSDISSRVDTLYAYCLNTICSTMFQEQNHITKFFIMNTATEEVQISNPSFESTTSNVQSDGDNDANEGKTSIEINTNSATSSQSAAQNGASHSAQNVQRSEIYLMMERMFKDINDDLVSITNYVKKNTDRFYSLSMSLAAERQFRMYNGKSTYITEFLIFVKGLIQEIIQKFITKQIESIQEFKCTIKKVHVVPFIAKFSYFNDRFESILTNFSDMSVARSSATTDYLKIISAMFDSIEKLAQTNEKHSDAFRMKNYSYFYHSLNKRPNLSQNEELIKHNEIAKKRFEECCRRYILWMINFKFEFLFHFIDGLEDCIKTTSKEDIIYQTQYSKAKVKELIKKYDHQVMQKGIESIFKRMDKHIGQKNVDDSSYKIPKAIEERGPKVLHKEVWSRLRKFFVSKYERFEKIINEAYPTCKPVSTREVEAMFDSFSFN